MSIPHRVRWPALAALALLLVSGPLFSAQAADDQVAANKAADVQFPVGSRIGLAPMPGLERNMTFPGFGDGQNNVFIRLIALPDKAYEEIEKTMTDEGLKQQGLIVEKREALTLPSGKALLVVAQQTEKTEHFRKWLLIAPIADLTVLVSLEVPEEASKLYPETAIRAALQSVTVRPSVPVEEELALVPFKVGELAGFRIARVMPGVAVQLTDGPKNTFDAVDQPHIVISASQGGPEQAADRDRFARDAMNALPPFKELRVVGSESMRIGGQQGYELRAEGKDPNTGTPVDIVQWLRFGTGAYLRVVAFSPRDKWAAAFTRFRAVRDGVDSR